MHDGFLLSTAHAPPLTSAEVAQIQAIFAACYGGSASDWRYVEEADRWRITHHAAAPLSTLHHGYATPHGLSDTALALSYLRAHSPFPAHNLSVAYTACTGRRLDRHQSTLEEVEHLSASNGRQQRPDGSWKTITAAAADEPALQRSFLNLDHAAAALCDALDEALRSIAEAHARRSQRSGLKDVVLELSGGIDSTLIAILARRHFTHLRTITVTSPLYALSANAHWAQSAAHKLALDWRSICRDDLLRADERCDTTRLEPALPRGWDAGRALQKHLHTQGVGLVLTGHGADGLFALTSGEAARQKQQWGTLAWGRVLASMSLRRQGKPSTQWLKNHLHVRTEEDRFHQMGPWYHSTHKAELRHAVTAYAQRMQQTAWQRCQQDAFFAAIDAQQHPGNRGYPTWYAHPFLHPSVIQQTRQIPPWPHFHQKAVLRRALEHAGFHAHAQRPKESILNSRLQHKGAPQTQMRLLRPLLDRSLRLLDEVSAPWADAQALLHALTRGDAYPMAMMLPLLSTAGVLEWDAHRQARAIAPVHSSGLPLPDARTAEATFAPIPTIASTSAASSL